MITVIINILIVITVIIPIKIYHDQLLLYLAQRDGGVVLSRVVSFSAGAPAGGFLAPV